MQMQALPDRVMIQRFEGGFVGCMLPEVEWSKTEACP